MYTVSAAYVNVYFKFINAVKGRRRGEKKNLVSWAAGFEYKWSELVCVCVCGKMINIWMACIAQMIVCPQTETWSQIALKALHWCLSGHTIKSVKFPWCLGTPHNFSCGVYLIFTGRQHLCVCVDENQQTAIFIYIKTNWCCLCKKHSRHVVLSFLPDLNSLIRSLTELITRKLIRTFWPIGLNDLKL